MVAGSASAQSSWPGVLFSAGLCIAILGALCGEMHLWDELGPQLWGAARFPMICGLALASIGCFFRWRQKAPWPTLIHGPTFGLSLFFLAFTDWFTRSYSLFPGPSIRGEWILTTLLAWWITKRNLWREAATIIAVATPIAATVSFFILADGRLIFSDDHPVFLFRLVSLTHAFPAIPFFNPLWNGGIDARDFFATGALNVFFLLLPVIYLTDLFQSYNLVVAFVVFLLPVVTVFGAARVQRLSWCSTAISIALATCLSLVWYRWGLKYGTMGFVTSACLVPLNIALLTRIITPSEKLSRAECLLTVVTVTLMLFWSLAGIVLLPLIALGVFRAHKLLVKPTVRLFLALAIAINLPWMAMFISVSKVHTFLKAERPSYNTLHEADYQASATAAQPPAAAPKDFRFKRRDFTVERALELLREQAITLNPLLLCLALPGVLLLRQPHRRSYILTLGWLMILGAGVAQVKPQLELDRMLLVAALISVIPTALALESLLIAAPTRPQARSQTNLRGFASGVGGLGILASGGAFLLSPWLAASAALNRTLEHYFFATPVVQSLATAIDTYGGSGRTLFSGFVLHELEHGHLAPLVYLTSKPLIASSYAHDQWRYKHVIPPEFLTAGEAGREQFMDLYNVTTVAAHEPLEIKYLRSNPARYQERWSGGKFSLFSRHRDAASGYFLKGAGTILTQSPTGVSFSLDTPDAVLAFNYFHFLAAPPCTVSPYDAPGGIRLIALSGCPTGVPLRLAATNPVNRYRDLWGGAR